MARCGGMAFAVVDPVNAHMGVPSYTTADFPGTAFWWTGKPLADYIYARLIDSVVCSSANQFVSSRVASDQPNWSRSAGLLDRARFLAVAHEPSQRGQARRLRPHPDRNLGEIADNHQVFGYGYDGT